MFVVYSLVFSEATGRSLKRNFGCVLGDIYPKGNTHVVKGALVYFPLGYKECWTGIELVL